MAKIQPTILVVEDDPTLLSAIVHKMSLSGIITLKAQNAEVAKDLLREHPEIELVWLDHSLLNQGNGVEIITEIKANPSWSHKIIILVSNTSEPGVLETYLALGVTHYYMKSDHSLTEIIADIKNMLD